MSFSTNFIIYITNYFQRSLLLLRNIFYKSSTNSNPKLYIFSLHSTAKKDYQDYIKLFSEINKISPFISPNEIKNYFSSSSPKHFRSRSLLTLDDGFVDNYDFSINVLDKLNIKAIFFVIPYFFSNQKNIPKIFLKYLYPKIGKNIPYSSLHVFRHLSLEQVLCIHSRGHKIGIHGLKHESATSLSSEDLSESVKQALKIVKPFVNELEHYCYPFGSANHFSKETNTILRKSFRFLHTGLRGYNSEKEYVHGILKRHTISTHGEDLIYSPYNFEQVYFLAFNPFSKTLLKIYKIIKSLFNPSPKYHT